MCRPVGPLQVKTSLLALIAAVAVIASVLAFQHIGGFIPCKLCYLQREPYYIAIPALAIAFVSARRGQACVSRGMLWIGFVSFLATAAMGAFHSGVEWGWWPGPADCGVVVDAVTTDASKLLNQLRTVKAPACNEAAGRFLGLSFAGWNVIVAIVLFVVALRGAAGPARRSRGE